MAAMFTLQRSTHRFFPCLRKGNYKRIQQTQATITPSVCVGCLTISSNYHSHTFSKRIRFSHNVLSSPEGLRQQLTTLQVPILLRAIYRHNSTIINDDHKAAYVDTTPSFPNEEVTSSASVTQSSHLGDASPPVIDNAVTVVDSTPVLEVHPVTDIVTPIVDSTPVLEVHPVTDIVTPIVDSTPVLESTTLDVVNSPPVTEAAASATTSSTFSAVDSVPVDHSTIVSESLEYIPPPPALPEAVSEALNALGEPTLQSLGLGGWTPIGIIQNCLEYLHVTADLPWWAAIGVMTVCLRTLLFPLVIKSQKNAAKMNNNMPQLQVLQMKMTEARNSGNQMEAARYSQEMMTFMKEKDMNPLKNVLVPLAQAPIFISMFIGLRRMASLPLESMTHGGILWFTDLTLCDPYYLLPVLTSVTMLATIELGTDGARASNANLHTMKWVLRSLPLFIFPFAINFPTAILCYWTATNMFSLVQVGFLRIPAVRETFKIDKLVSHKPETLPQKKGFVEGFKENWSNMKITKELENRQKYDEMRFNKAGLGPVVRTYKHDPTKRSPIKIQAKASSK